MGYVNECGMKELIEDPILHETRTEYMITELEGKTKTESLLDVTGL